MPTESVRAASRWTTRGIPLVLAAAVGYATYVIVARVCVDYLLRTKRDTGAAIAVLVLYSVFFLLMLASYGRTILIITTDPGLVPLGPAAIERRNQEKRNGEKKNKRKLSAPDTLGGDVGGQPYDAGPDPDPDSPGLEHFYTKDVFTCENDGRPRWCSVCSNWKPDRAYHSSEIRRCVMKMDHYCPWVGGMVGGHSFKFFTQFTMYTACYCAVVLGAAGSSLKEELDAGWSPDGFLIGVLALGGFFGLFTFLMTVTSWRYIALNMTNIEMLADKKKVYQLAVKVPRGSPHTDQYNTIDYPLQPAMYPHRTRSREETNDVEANGTGLDGTLAQTTQRQTARDALATRTYAILKTAPGENPWDLGVKENWKEVMGTNVLDWFLPIRRSPAVKHYDSHQSFYRTGAALREICARYGLQGMPEDDEKGGGLGMGMGMGNAPWGEARAADAQ